MMSAFFSVMTLAAVLHVGPAQQFKTPSAAAAGAHDGDTIEIAAGEYAGDVAVWSANKLTIRGVNGTVHLAANGKSAQQKAIWVIRGNDTTVEHIEFSGCHVPDHNGAGIRQEGRGLIVRHCRFRNNEDGILAGANPESDILVEYSEFGPNGHGDGLSHNIYIGRIRKFTFQFCYSHHANIGHLVKSRAEQNFIYYNRLADEQDGRSSYVIDLPNGGQSFIIGNIIQHGPRAENGVAVSYAAEGAKSARQELYVVNNTVVHERARGASFVRAAGPSPTVRVINNLVTGTTQMLTGPGVATNNLDTLASAIDVGKVGEFSLVPTFRYRHPLGAIARAPGEKLEIGAGSVLNKVSQ